MSRLVIEGQSSASKGQANLSEIVSRRIQSMTTDQCSVDFTLSLVRVMLSESCGKCTPCRVGLQQAANLMEALLNGEGDMATVSMLKAIAQNMLDSADCAIGYEAGRMLGSALESFKDDFESHACNDKCSDRHSSFAPCQEKCPAHVEIPGYIAYAAQGDYENAIKMIRKDNPFPTMCALVCEHPCEMSCRRSFIDAPVNIRGIKKLAVDQVAADTVAVPSRAADTGKKVAIVGGGPSGLTCAYYLALMGHSVTVFEMRNKLGGMTRYGIPAYRFPRERLDEDIRAILSVGNIEVKLNTKMAKEDEERLCAEYDAVYVAVGAQLGKTLKMDGSDAEGVMSAVDLLGMIGDDEYPDFTGKKVAVIGGGNVAMDCCRTAVRAGADVVTCVYRRRIEDMTALPAEIESAMQEGVEMMTLAAPVRVEVDESGKCAALIAQPQYISAVRGGRPAPAKADKPEVRVEADVVLIAVGQDIMSTRIGMPAKSRKTYEADSSLKAAGFDNVFVGGDCQTGPATVIRAIAAGKVAAANIDEFLGFDHKIDFGVEAPLATPNDSKAYGRVEIVERPAWERKHDFGYVEQPMSLEEAAQECGRCLRCDHYGFGKICGKGAQQW